jgi:phosphotriesterase-related protein
MTLLHEHVIWQFDDSRRKPTLEFTTQLLEKAYQLGIRSVVDLTPFRRIDWFMDVAANTGMNIIPCTGYYVESSISPSLFTANISQMVERMVNELNVGIDNTKVRAGIIKVAGVNPQLTPWEVQVFTAAAKAHLKTGACIAAHAVAGTREQAEVLLNAGADLNRVFFSHIDTQSGWEGRTVKEEAVYLEAIARMGGCLLLNNFGCEFFTKPEDEIYLMRHLCDAGYSEKVFISIDCNWTWNQAGKIEFEEEARHPEAGMRTYAYMMSNTVPDLMKSGFTEQDIQTFLVDNPRRFFSRSGAG